MKQTLLLLAAFASVTAATAQSIQNPGFETWYTTNEGSVPYFVPQHWTSSDMINTVLFDAFGQPNVSSSTVSQSSSSHGGQYAIDMSVGISSLGDTVSGGVITCDSATDFLVIGFGGGGALGFPFSTRPALFTGYYKLASVGGDQGGAALVLTKWNTTTMSRDTLFSQNVYATPSANWAQFSLPVTYAYNEYPDTLFISTGINNTSSNEHPGTLFSVDDLALSGSVPLGIQEQTNTMDVSFFPNPMTTSSTLVLRSGQMNHATLNLYDMTGKRVRSENDLLGNMAVIEREGLVSGMYFYTLSDASGLHVSGKIAVQ